MSTSGNHPGLNFGRLAIVAAAVAAAMFLLVQTDGHPAVLIGGAILLIATGTLVNRAWAAALPLVFVFGWIGYDAAVHGTDNHGDMSWWGYAVLFAAFGALVSFVLLVGVGIRRAARAVRRGRTTAPARS
jgi:hypothetical protein